MKTELRSIEGRIGWSKTSQSDVEAMRLRNEATVLRAVRHPNVVELLTADDAGAEVITIYCGRSTLADAPPSDLVELADLAEALLTVLGELHAMGWAHGSIAPAHCLLGGGGRLVLCSLARATAISGPTHPAARADRDAARAMLATWRDALPTPRSRAERTAAARLDRVVSSSGAALPLFRRPTAPAERRRPARARADAMRKATVRLVTFVALLVVTMAISVPTADSTASNDVVVAVTRWVLVAARPLAAYGVVVTAMYLFGLWTRRESLARLSGRLAPSWLHRTITGVALAGTLSSLAMSNASGTRAALAIHAAEAVPDASTTTSSVPPTTPSDAGAQPAPETTLDPLAAPPISVTTSVAAPVEDVSPEPVAAPVDEVSPEPVAPPARATWSVRPGDHLWRVAEQTLTAAWARSPTDREIDPYWRALITANQAKLADQRNPSLVFVGQVLDLPPPPDPPESPRATAA